MLVYTVLCSTVTLCGVLSLVSEHLFSLVCIQISPEATDSSHAVLTRPHSLRRQMRAYKLLYNGGTEGEKEGVGGTKDCLETLCG